MLKANERSFINKGNDIKTKSDKRADIMQAALEIIAERGFHDSPMADISEKAGVAAGTIYRYFENKEVLIRELHQELEEEIVSILVHNYSFEQSVRERFLYLLNRLFLYFIAHPLHFRYMEQYYNSPYGISLHKDRLLGTGEHQNIIMEMFAEGIQQQVIKDFPRGILFSLSFGPLSSLMRDYILGFIELNESIIKKITEACWDAIKESKNSTKRGIT